MARERAGKERVVRKIGRREMVLQVRGQWRERCLRVREQWRERCLCERESGGERVRSEGEEKGFVLSLGQTRTCSYLKLHA